MEMICVLFGVWSWVYESHRKPQITMKRGWPDKSLDLIRRGINSDSEVPSITRSAYDGQSRRQEFIEEVRLKVLQELITVEQNNLMRKNRGGCS